MEEYRARAVADAGGRDQVRDFLVDQLREATGEDFSALDTDELILKVYGNQAVIVDQKDEQEEEEEEEDEDAERDIDVLLAELDKAVLTPLGDDDDDAQDNVAYTGQDSDMNKQAVYWKGALTTELWLKASQAQTWDSTSV